MRLPSGLRRALRTLGLSLLFALVYSPAPLYTSNQHQYFLHGLARAGVGRLAEDWLANTRDPTPVFSGMVEVLARVAPQQVFYVVYALLLGVYLLGLISILRTLGLLPDSAAGQAAVVAALLGMHSAALRFTLARAVGPGWEYALEGGVAGQRLLGPVLQPSSFGVLLVVSVAEFLRQRPLRAAAWAAAGATAHPTYLLSSGVLVLAYVLLTLRRPGGARRALATALTAVLLSAPIAGYTYLQFRPSGPDWFAMAQSILVERIPHHALPEAWWGPPVILAALMVAWAAWRVRGSALSPLLASLGAFAILGTLAQVVSGSLTLALLFPWRISVLLVPLSASILAAALASRLSAGASALLLRALPALIVSFVVVLALAGVARSAIELDQMREDPARPMFEFVRGSLRPGQVYFIPPKLDPFRLETGAPIVADSKSIPYLDVQVIEWSERLRLAGFFFRDRVEYMGCGPLAEAQTTYGATHVVLGPQQIGFECPGWRELYRDENYALYELGGGS